MRSIWKLNTTAFLTALLLAITSNAHAGNVEVKLPTNSAFQVISGAQPLMHVGSNGNVGIGTSSPNAKLEVYGSNNAANLIVNSPAIGGIGDYSDIEFRQSGSVQGKIGIVSEGNWPFGLRFFTSAGQNIPTEKVRITSNGNVGIGTTSPAYKLHVANGNTYVDSPYLYYTGVIIGLNGSPQNTLFRLNDLNGHFGFEEGSSHAELLTILNNGNVGVGTTTPSYKLHVNGTAAGTSWTNLSSREFKEDINVVGESEHPMMLAKLMEMDLNRYKYKKEFGGDGEAKLGFIAEEMPKEVLSKDGKGVDVYELLAFTIGAMKAQQKEIETQRQYNKALEDRLAALEKMLKEK